MLLGVTLALNSHLVLEYVELEKAGRSQRRSPIARKCGTDKRRKAEKLQLEMLSYCEEDRQTERDHILCSPAKNSVKEERSGLLFVVHCIPGAYLVNGISMLVFV